jgi:hypothetical protein
MQFIHVFSCSFTIRVYPLSHFQLFLILPFSLCYHLWFLSNLFVTHFFFLFRQIASRLIGETTNVVRVTDLFFPFLSIPRVIVRGPYIHEDVGSPFSYPAWEYSVGLLLLEYFTFLQMEHLWMVAWPSFPGLKVGQKCIYSSFLTIYSGVDYKMLDSTEYDYS